MRPVRSAQGVGPRRRRPRHWIDPASPLPTADARGEAVAESLGALRDDGESQPVRGVVRPQAPPAARERLDREIGVCFGERGERVDLA